MEKELSTKELSPDQAIKKIADIFPFPSYMSRRYDIRNAYLNIADTVMRYLRPGAKILDFGSGPCDKTAVLQILGYQCSAWDDLQDDWHKREGERNKILAFAHTLGIDFRLANQSKFSFRPEAFDMVMMHDVLEHLHDSPRDLLNDLLSLCKPRGYLFITVPNAANIRKRIDLLFGKTNYQRYELYYWYPNPWRGHIREYVKDDLVQLSKYLNVEILEIRGCDHMLVRIPKWAQRLYCTATDCFKGLKDSWSLVVRKEANWVAKKTLPCKELDLILGRTTTYVYEQ